MSGKLSVANLIAGVGALVTLLFSFFAYIEAGGESRNAWSSDSDAFLVTVPAILAIAMLVLIGLSLAEVKLPDVVLTFNWDQIKATWGIAAAGIMVAALTVDTRGADRGFGFWLMLLGSFAMAAGTVMVLLGKGTEVFSFPQTGGGKTTSTTTPPAPPTSGGTAPPPPPEAPSGGTPPPPPPDF
jgi:hypothetical protein